MVSISQVISVIKKRQADIAYSLGQGNASTWESYQRMVGIFSGHQEVIDIINKLLQDEEEKDNDR
jgi:hypothetical protein